MKMGDMEKAGRVVARMTAEDRHKLILSIDECLSAAIKFNETRKPEYFVKMKNSMERFVKTLEQLEKESNTL